MQIYKKSKSLHFLIEYFVFFKENIQVSQVQKLKELSLPTVVREVKRQ